MQITQRHSRRIAHDPLGLTLLVALAIHALIILGVSFDIQRKNPPPPERTLDITLVTPSKKPPLVEQPDMLAQANQQGGGEEISKQRPSSIATEPSASAPVAPAQPARPSGAVQPEPEQSRQVITQTQAQRKQLVQTEEPQRQAPPAPDLAQLLSSTQREIERLTAEIDRRSRAASTRDRRKAVNAQTQEYKYAAYLESWRKKVERIGNLNYPDEAKRRKLYGALVLHVAVRADGSIEEVRVLRSSGQKILDDAAQRIVRLAAPYAPFPANIRAEVDVLDITRTWQFRSGNQLLSAD